MQYALQIVKNKQPNVSSIRYNGNFREGHTYKNVYFKIWPQIRDTLLYSILAVLLLIN